ncbi:MAG: ribonuclease Z [Candidatus Lokiarchaeota archaeon]|nr:ribonuclease Z [Candidatus Lokiarchaeota archaeon]
MKIHFLGTSATVPTLDRNVSSIAIENFNEIILFDCGEGTLIQCRKQKLKISKITKIFISHFHGDHFLGIPALLMTYSLFKRTKPLGIYGPIGILEYIDFIMKFIESDLSFRLDVIELKNKESFKFLKYSIEAIETQHRIQNFSFKYIENARYGKFNNDKASKLKIPNTIIRKKIKEGNAITLENGRIISPEDVCDSIIKEKIVVYSGDTRPIEKLRDFAKNADVLIMESTFFNDLKEKALETNHSTLEEAIDLGQSARVKNLILTHFSSRYKTLEVFNEYINKLKSKTYIYLASDFFIFSL